MCVEDGDCMVKRIGLVTRILRIRRLSQLPRSTLLPQILMLGLRDYVEPHKLARSSPVHLSPRMWVTREPPHRMWVARDPITGERSSQVKTLAYVRLHAQQLHGS